MSKQFIALKICLFTTALTMVYCCCCCC